MQSGTYYSKGNRAYDARPCKRIKLRSYSHFNGALSFLDTKRARYELGSRACRMTVTSR
jgi:hypothetical protein